MNISESLKIAIKCIKANWMRSLLTMLGIIIGVGSVIMIVSAGTGARDYIVSLIEDMGSNAVLVSVDTTQATDNDYITLDDVANIKKKVSGVDRCSPMMMGFAKSDAQFVLQDGTKYGRFFTDEEYSAASPIAIIGTESAKMAFGYEDVTGQYLTLSSSGSAMKVKVVGVADIDSLVNSVGGNSSLGEMFQTGDNLTIAIFMPCTTLTQLTGSDPVVSSVFVIGESTANNEAIGNATVNYLKAAHGNYANSIYTAQDMATYVELVDTIISILTAFIAAVGAISLIVGGIGVMNIMLVSVTERTREIGIRKSLGAKTKTITLQFLTESVILCLIGGIIGTVLGIAGAFAACAIIKITPDVNIGVIAIALLFSCGVGLFFGIYPARKAAKMSPIEALRRE